MEQILKMRDIVLVPFPFSDQTGSKRRPALVMSSDRFNAASDDIVVAAITSYLPQPEANTIPIAREDWKDGLYSESYVKAWVLMAIDKQLIIKRIGRLTSQRHAQVAQKVREILFMP